VTPDAEEDLARSLIDGYELDLTGVWLGGRVYLAAVVRQRSFFLRNWLCVKEGLYRRFAAVR